MDQDRNPPSARSRSLRLGLVAAGVALVAATLAGAGAQALWGDDDEPERPDPEVVLRFGAEDQDPEGLVNRTREGDQLPDESFPLLDGASTTFADYRGRPLVVNFFASWCTPCIEEMPDLEAVHQELGREVAFLGMNLRDPVADATRLVERTGVTYDIGRDPSGELFQALGGVTMPTTFLVDADGQVVEVVAGKVSADELRDKLGRLR